VYRTFLALPIPGAVGAGDVSAFHSTFWGKNVLDLGKFGWIWEKLRRNVGKISAKDFANLIRFGQNQNLASPKTVYLLRLSYYPCSQTQNANFILECCKMTCTSTASQKKEAIKGRVHCFSMQVVMNKRFLLNPEKNLAQISLVVFEKNAKTHL